MHTDNNHNTHTNSELYKIIETVRQREGKSTLKLLAERIGRSISGTWHLLTDAGMPTRLYSESLSIIEDRLRAEGPTLTLQELYERHGTNWANPLSFYAFLSDRGITHAPRAKRRTNGFVSSSRPTTTKTTRQRTRQLLKDVRENGYDLSTLTRLEIAEMYELAYSTTCAYVSRHQLPCRTSARTRRKHSAPSALL